MKNDFLIAIKQLCAEKNLPEGVVLEAIEAALNSAYKRDAGANQNVNVKFVRATGEVKVFVQKTVVETVSDPHTEITLAEARRWKPDAALGDVIEIESTPHDFGRIAAQTAKQVVLQRLREAEREVVFEEFIDKEGDIVSGIVQRIEPKQVAIDLGKTEAILPSTEQVPGEHYRRGQRLKVYLVEVQRTSKGPQLIVSRTHRNLLRRLFELEVPEIYNGTVELKAIAREAGSRSKVAVAARQEGVDPVGSCVGLRGIRIQNIVNELGGEKIDVVQWHPDPELYVANALSPAQVLNVEINDEEKTAAVVVPDRQLSLAIGKEGQNARLAAKLTGWRIDIKSASAAKAEKAEREAMAAAQPPAEQPVPTEEVQELAATMATEAPGLESVETTEVPEQLTTQEPIVEPAELAEEPSLIAGLEPAIEPELAAEMVEEAVEAVEEELEEADQPIDLSTYHEPLPAMERPQQIRFAEDLLGPERPWTEGKRKKAKGKKGAEPEPQVDVKPKKVRKQRYVEEIDEEDVEQYNYDFLKKSRK